MRKPVKKSDHPLIEEWVKGYSGDHHEGRSAAQKEPQKIRRKKERKSKKSR